MRTGGQPGTPYKPNHLPLPNPNSRTNARCKTAHVQILGGVRAVVLQFYVIHCLLQSAIINNPSATTAMGVPYWGNIISFPNAALPASKQVHPVL